MRQSVKTGPWITVWQLFSKAPTAENERSKLSRNSNTTLRYCWTAYLLINRAFSLSGRPGAGRSNQQQQQLERKPNHHAHLLAEQCCWPQLVLGLLRGDGRFPSCKHKPLVWRHQSLNPRLPKNRASGSHLCWPKKNRILIYYSTELHTYLFLNVACLWLAMSKTQPVIGGATQLRLLLPTV